MRSKGLGIIAASTLLIALTVIIPLWATAQKFEVLHNFTGSEGGFPWAGLVRDDAGNLYGTTGRDGAYGAGTVFKLDPKSNVTVLHNFTDAESAPYAALLRDADGNLYGTTDGNFLTNYGIVFKLDSSRRFTVLHVFTGGPDGAEPVASVIRDAQGNLYGTTVFTGAPICCGTIFKVDRAGTETVLHRFEGPDGTSPAANLVEDREGNLYGAAGGGGAYGYGTIFELATTGKFTVLHSFRLEEGAYPAAGLLREASGDLYGTTQGGGSHGHGTVFRLDRRGRLTVLHAFTGQDLAVADGSEPAAGLIRDAAGNLYGTTVAGGTGSCLGNGGGCGTVFELSKTGEETVLHSFQGRDGAFPQSALVRDASDNLYGTALGGGTGDCLYHNPCGTVFKITVNDNDSGHLEQPMNSQ